MNKITGNAVEVDKLLNNRYTVQYYQREYNWEKKQIEELIEDLTGEFLEFYQPGHTQQDVSGYGNYFLGPIILTNDNAIIDGQQRLSSLTLLLIYLNNLQNGNSGPNVNVDNLIFSQKHGLKTFCLNVPERKTCLEYLYAKGKYDITNDKSESVINLYNRYQDIEEVFPEDLKVDILPLFMDWLIYNVVFIEIRTHSEQDAHKVFVAMNDRGLRLTPADMLKGYILSEMNYEDMRNKANDVWKENILRLKDMEKDGESDFIKNWLRAQYADSIREGKKGAEDKDYEVIGQTFHKWVRDNKSQMGLSNSTDFEQLVLKRFKTYSDIYLKLKHYATVFDNQYPYVFYNANRDFTLQFQMILASINEDDTADLVAKKINLVSCFIDQFIAIRVFNFKTVDYSSIRYTIFNLTKKIRGKSLTELVVIFKDYINSMDYTLDGIDRFFLNGFSARYMLHILARMTYYLESNCGKNSTFYEFVNRNQKNPYDIEHIWANDYSQGIHKADFNSEEEFVKFRDQFGGLLILPKDKNRSYQDMDYSLKVDKYDSENLIARTLHTNCYSNNPSFLKFISTSKLSFKDYQQFNKAELVERQSLYKDMCKKIWNIEIFDQIVQ